MRRVVVETPFRHKRGDEIGRKRIWRYLRAALRDCILRGEAPFASHAIYAQPGVLDDDIPAQREQGITAGFAWGDVADARVVYQDLGVTSGMQLAIDRSMDRGQEIEVRNVPGWRDE